MTYDDYDMMYERLMYLKKNQNNLSLNERTKKLLKKLENTLMHLKCTRVFFNTRSSEKSTTLWYQRKAGISVYPKSMWIKNKNSLELTYRYYGYVKPITPAILNQVIDDVATRVQLENEYARTVHAPSPQDEKEDQLTLNELGQFEH